ncbi:CYFA0S01e12574g1_1 [Cyberlindnera fabianii]|uniref:CYFA0S01e12574g1_1 n=1 Tax=Cyberlindnera fabianii TaxID=36022 RepID=A0A061AS78_CYBFA|nr:CYFA0S01e12574g1_1 [Cyberlindnera fabianii]
MPKGAKISLDTAHTHDFAPGVDNVRLRRDGVEFYAPATFHLSPFYTKITPVFACDVINSVSLSDVYGIEALGSMCRDVVLLKNHPVRKIRIMGRITGYSIHSGTERNKGFYLLNIDDSSGSEIICKLLESQMLGFGLGHQGSEGLLVEVMGTLEQYRDVRQLKVEFLEIMESGPKSIKVEMKFWQEVITVRKVLRTPWFQSPQIDNSNGEMKVRIETKALKRRLIARNLKLSEDPDDYIPLVLDSIIYIQKKLIRKPERDTMVEIDEDDSASDLEEITRDVFEKKSLLSIGIYSELTKPIDKLWFAIEDKKHPLRVVHSYTEHELCIRLIHWTTNHISEKFHLEETFKSTSISSFLDKMAAAQFPLQVVNSSQPSDGIRSIEQLRKDYFRNARHRLQRTGLIRCWKSQKGSSKLLRKFYTELYHSVFKIKSLAEQGHPLTFLTENFVSVFNHKNNTDIDLESDMVDRLIYTILKADKDPRWRYEKEKREWSYETSSVKDVKRRKIRGYETD